MTNNKVPSARDACAVEAAAEHTTDLTSPRVDPPAPEDIEAPKPFLHLPSGTVRFWVLVGGQFVGASIRREILHYRYHATQTDDDPMVTYAANRAEIHAAVQRRVAKGSIEPVMLRDSDIRKDAA